MKLNMHIGKVEDSNYQARKYSVGSPFYRDICWNQEIESFSVYWSFSNWLSKKYASDFIEHQYHDRYINKEVLVVTTDSIDMLSEEEFFRLDGDLTKLFFNHKIDDVYKEYLLEKENKN